MNKRRKKGWRQPNHYIEKGASLIGALLCYKDTNVVGVLLSAVTHPLVHMDP
jgi:hypothetical protein